MRKLTERDLADIRGSVISGYHIEDVRIKNGPFIDSDHYGFLLGKNASGEYVTWQFHLLNDGIVSTYWGHYYMGNREAAVQDFHVRDRI